MKDIPVGRQIGLGAGLFVAAMVTASLIAILFFGWRTWSGVQKEAGYAKPHPNSDARSGSLEKDEKISKEKYE